MKILDIIKDVNGKPSSTRTPGLISGLIAILLSIIVAILYFCVELTDVQEDGVYSVLYLLFGYSIVMLGSGKLEHIKR